MRSTSNWSDEVLKVRTTTPVHASYNQCCLTPQYNLPGYAAGQRSLQEHYRYSSHPYYSRKHGRVSPPPRGRKRISVACGRCRKRKIKCSGDKGDGKGCAGCQTAGMQTCSFYRVGAGEYDEVKAASTCTAISGRNSEDDKAATEHSPHQHGHPVPDTIQRYYSPNQSSDERNPRTFEPGGLSMVTHPVHHPQWNVTGHELGSPLSSAGSFNMSGRISPVPTTYPLPAMAGEGSHGRGWHPHHNLPHNQAVPLDAPSSAEDGPSITDSARHLLSLGTIPGSSLSEQVVEFSEQICLPAQSLVGVPRMLPMPPPLRPRSPLYTRPNIPAGSLSQSSISASSLYHTYSDRGTADNPSRFTSSPLCRTINLAASYNHPNPASPNAIALSGRNDTPTSACAYSMDGLPRAFTDYPQTYAALSAVRDTHEVPKSHSPPQIEIPLQHDPDSCSSRPYQGSSLTSAGTTNTRSLCNKSVATKSTSSSDIVQARPSLNKAAAQARPAVETDVKDGRDGSAELALQPNSKLASPAPDLTVSKEKVIHNHQDSASTAYCAHQQQPRK